ncbi:TetR/AcrR family transcriptional regulator [Microbacterium sp. BWT-B31]|uniref:TetR/AcrR family transcriptional regulator n=1 Tax=Microbacterium sp. BWT-B31 TaxID=3232072 RepID=UPI003527842F
MTDPPLASRAELTRTRLLDAAITAFSEKGFHATTTRDIAGAAGMSPAAVYVHHRSKEDLLHLISRHGHRATLELVRDARASAGDPVSQLAAVAHAFAAYHAENHTVARVLNYELSALTPAHQDEIAELRKGIDTELREIVGDGIAAGLFDTSDPALAATALASLGVDIARWYREEGAWSPQQVAEFYSDLALRMVGAHSHPR